MNTVDDEPAVPPPPGLAHYTGFLLRRAYVRVLQHAQSGMPSGRHPRELAILTTLEEQGPLSQRRLGELLDINRTIMVNAADTLEANGLLSRERDPADRRSYALRTTAAGKAALADMSRGADDAEVELTAALTESQRPRLVALLSSIVPELPPRVPKQLAERAGFLIAKAHHRLRSESEAALRDLGIAPRHFGLLTTLTSIAPCSQQCLAGALGISGPAVVQTLNALERDALIARQCNPADRRERLFRLTDKGQDTLAQATTIIDDMHQRLADRIGEPEMRELNALLTAIITSCSAVQ